MKVLLTGASGFVGSHILDCLAAEQIPTALLLRRSSDRRFLTQHLKSVETRTGALNEPSALDKALSNITHVIHCAGCTKAVRTADYYEINHVGTRNLLDAINRVGSSVERFLLISSLAAAGPATAEKPARESDPPRPISHYGQSKLAAELEVRTLCRVAATIIRPPAVYGTRDEGFLSLFKAIQRHVLPRPSATQALSLVYVKDLARAVVACLRAPTAGVKTYFVAGKQIVTPRKIADTISAQAKRWTLPCPLPPAALWPICVLQEMLGHITRKPTLLNRQKFRELTAPGWVCDPSLLKQELGFECSTTLEAGVTETLNWYRHEKWV